MISLNGVLLNNRVLTASSMTAYGITDKFTLDNRINLLRFIDITKFGAVVTRTLTLSPREGFVQQDTPRYQLLRKVDSGWLNAFGWSNIGLDTYLHTYLPNTVSKQRVVVSVGGYSVEDYIEHIHRLNDVDGLCGVELNLSCPNVDADFEILAEQVLGRVHLSRHPIFVKLSADMQYLKVARMAVDGGARVLVAINSLRGLRFDFSTGRPFLKAGIGGLSGRAIKPIALRVIYDLRADGIQIPIIGTGGIRTINDYKEYRLAGADAVAVGSELWLARNKFEQLLHILLLKRLLQYVRTQPL